MSKYQVIFYSSISNSRYSYFVKIDNVDTKRHDDCEQAVEKVWDEHISKLGIDVGEINCRKVR